MRTFSPFLATCGLGLFLLAGTSCASGTSSDDASDGTPSGGIGGESSSGGAPSGGGSGGAGPSGGSPGSGGSGGGNSSAQPCHTRVETDFQGDGSINETHELDYDDAGNLVKDEADLSIPYDIDVTTAYTYDGQGNILTELEDRSDKPPSLTTYHYRDDGQLDLIEYDNGADGSVEGTDDYVYGADGALTEVDLAFEGSPTTVCRATWLAERELKLDCDQGDDGSIEQSERRLRNESGQFLERERYSPGDGSSLGLDTYSYNDAGDLLKVVKEVGGEPASVVTYTHDEERNLVSVEEVAADGSIFSRSSYKHTFECN